LLASCSKSREEKVKEVCDCFREKKSAPMECFKIQHDYANSFSGEDKTKFLQETNMCD
jgi:hypothetical protein